MLWCLAMFKMVIACNVLQGNKIAFEQQNYIFLNVLTLATHPFAALLPRRQEFIKWLFQLIIQFSVKSQLQKPHQTKVS